MSKDILRILTVLFFVISCGQNHSEEKRDRSTVQDSIFYNQVINDFSTQSYYLLLKVNDESHIKYEIVIQNDNLFHVLNKEGRLSKKEYRNSIEEVFKNTGELLIDSATNTSLLKYRFDREKCNCIGKKKAIEIVDRFFDKKYLKPKYADKVDTIRCVVAVLFEQGYYTLNDDESGYLMLSRINR